MAASTRHASSQPGAPADADAAHRRLHPQLERFGPFLVLAFWTALVTGLLAHFSLDSRLVFIDESNAVLFGRFIEADHAQLLHGNIARGPERLTSLLAAVAATASDDPSTQFSLLHFMTALAQGLIVVPVWLAARQLGLGRWQALAPAAIASSGSFAFYGATTLNTSVGLLSCALMLWAMLRSLRRPGLLSDVLIVATFALAVVARIGWAPLVGAIAPAVLATMWFERPSGERFGRWLLQLPRRLPRRHPLLTLGAVGLLLALVVIGPDPLVGGELYGGVRLHPQFTLDALWGNARILGSHLALGMAVIPFVLALPVILRGLVKPTDAVEGGFAWLVVALVVIFSYAYYFSMNEDRYFAVLAPAFVLAGALAVFRKPPPLWSVVASAVAVTVLVASSYRWPLGDVYAYFIAPTSRFFGDVVLGKLSFVIPIGRAPLGYVAIALAAAIAVALVLRTRLPARAGAAVGGAILAAMLVFQLASIYHPGKKFIDYVGYKTVSGDTIEFVDHAVEAATGSDQLPFGSAEPLQDDGGIHPDLAAQMPFLQVYNRSLGYRFAVNVEGDGVESPAPPQATIDWRTGAVALGREAPEVLLTIAGQSTIGFDSTPLRGSETFPWAGMEKLKRPLTPEWVMRGTLPDHFADPGRPIRVRVFPHDGQQCLSGTVTAHPLLTRPVPYTLDGARRDLRGAVAPGRPRAFVVRVPRTTTLVFRSTAARGTDGERHAAGLFDLRLESCAR